MNDVWQMGMPWQGVLISVLIGAPAAITFPIVLAMVRWNESRVGRASMMAGTALALAFIQGLLSLIFHSAGWFPWLILFVDSFLSVAVWFQLITFMRVMLEEEGKK